MIVSGSINSEPFGLRRKISVFLCISLCCLKAIQTCSNLLLHLLGLGSCSVIWSARVILLRQWENGQDARLKLLRHGRLKSDNKQPEMAFSHPSWTCHLHQSLLSPLLSLFGGSPSCTYLFKTPGGTSTSPQIQSCGFYLQNSNQ